MSTYSTATIESLLDRYIGYTLRWLATGDPHCLYAAIDYWDAGRERIGADAFRALIDRRLHP